MRGGGTAAAAESAEAATAAAEAEEAHVVPRSGIVLQLRRSDCVASLIILAIWSATLARWTPSLLRGARADPAAKKKHY